VDAAFCGGENSAGAAQVVAPVSASYRTRPLYEFGIVTWIRFENLLSFPFLFVAVVM
jgi:hypothetical protein